MTSDEIDSTCENKGKEKKTNYGAFLNEFNINIRENENKNQQI